MEKKSIKQKYKAHQDNLLLILHEIQSLSKQNYISREDMQWVADYLNITQSTVYGVVKYYSMFSTKPRGKYVIRFCKSPLCYMVGDMNIIKNLKFSLGVGLNEVTQDGLFSYEFSECLGHCDRAPVMMINEKVYGDLTPEKIYEIITEIRKTENN